MKKGIIIVNYSKYSLKSFDGFKFRVQISLKFLDGTYHRTDIYTSEEHILKLNTDLQKLINTKVRFFTIEHIASKKDDEHTSIILSKIFSI